MRVYFAGPLFTPYVREAITEHATILRHHGIEVFVPHEQNKRRVPPEAVARAVARGLIREEALAGRPGIDLVWDLVRNGFVQAEDLGIPPATPESVFEVDYAGLSAANAVVALLDGTQVDDGTACEIGAFYAQMRSDPSKKGILGYVMDSRGVRKAQQGYGLNLFVLGVIEECGWVTHDFRRIVAQLLAWDAELKARN